MPYSSLHSPSMIVSSKFNRPSLDQGVLVRKELHDQLDSGLTKKVTLVSSPAGFGKTTLINSWITACDYQVSWLSLDKHDNSRSRFLAYLDSSIDPSNQFMHGFVPNPKHQFDEDLSDKVLNHIFQVFTEAQTLRILVLDDYHLITNPEVHVTLNMILDNLPPVEETEDGWKGWHVVLLTRSDPPFPIWRWRLNGELNEIRTDDLRFSLEEAAVLLNQKLGLELSLEDVAEFNSRAEGWVAGLQLGAATMLGQKPKSFHKFISELKGSFRLLSDYLTEEVFLHQDASIQKFLLQTSILESMNNELCDAVLKRQGSQEILEFLERNNVFVVPLDYERHWYRYHNFFKDVLQNRLKTLADQDINTLHSRAAVWLGENGFYEDSIKHWLAADQPERAAQLVVEVASSLLNHGGFYSLNMLLGLFPEEVFKMSPWLSVYRAWTMFMLAPEETEIWLNIADRDARWLASENKLDRDELNAILGNIYAIRSITLANSESTQAVFSLASDALEYLPEEDFNVRGIVYNAMGTSSILMGEKHKAIDYFRKGKTILLRGRNYGATADSLRRIGDILKDFGELNQAAEAYKEAISFERYHASGEPYFTNMAYLGLGEVQFEWNDLENAISNFEAGHELSTRMGVGQQILCGAVIASAWLNLGQIEKAEPILQNYASYIGTKSISTQVDAMLTASQIEYLSALGNFSKVDHLAKQRNISIDAMDDITREPEFTAFAKSLYLRGHYKDALAFFSNLEQKMAAAGYLARQIRLLAFMSVTSSLLGENISAQNLAVRAINLAESEGYIRTFVSCGEPMLDLLVELSEPSLMKEYHLNRTYLGNIIAGFLNKSDGGMDVGVSRIPAAYGEEVIPGVMADALSRREMEVLKLVAADQTNSDIAEFLSISVNTVKSHTSNIYSKLGVSNRLQAVNRARKLGLL